MRDDSTAILPPGASASTICGMTRIGPRTLVRMTLSKSSSLGAVRPAARVPPTPALTMATSKPAPSICHASAEALAASATSRRIGVAPSARRRSRPASSRAEAVTASPASRYWRTNSRPMPREAPMTRMFKEIATCGSTALTRNSGRRESASEHLDRERRRLAAADAQRRHALLLVRLAQRAEQGDDDARAAGADRVAERDRAAVHVDDLVRQLELG